MQTVWLAEGPVRAAQWGLSATPNEVVWIEQMPTWLAEFAARGARRQLLSPRQQLALWQRVIDQSARGAQFLDRRAIAQWASQGWSLLRQYRVDDPYMHGGGQDLQALLEWSQTWESLLAEHRWFTRDHLLTELTRLEADGRLARSPRHLILLDLSELTPLEQACLDLLERAGWPIEHRSTPTVEARVQCCRAATPAAELDAALQWLEQRLRQHPEQRVALVVPPDDARGPVLRRRLAGRADAAFVGGRTPLDNPPVAAALTALEMLGPDGDAERLSAWLRSPFMQGYDPEALGDAARCELKDRDQLSGQLPLSGRRAPLIEMLAELAPSAANRLEAAWQLSAQAGDRAVPSAWIEIWQGQLAALGWLDQDKAARNSAVQALEQGFDALSSLAPMLKAIGPRRALEELRNVLNEPLIGSPLPVTGLHVLTDPGDLGPGYSAAWVTGVNDARWPLRGRPNPLLPQRLQRALNMPWADADYSRRKAEQMVGRLAAAVPDLRLSWAQMTDGELRGPAAVLAPFLESSPDNTRAVLDIAATASPGVRQSSADMEQLDDAMAARAHVKRLSGGASLLNLQASCPLRAFIDYRLHAGEVQRRTRGISRALRGQILHRAAAQLMKPGTRSEQLPEHAAGNWATHITAAAQRALRREFGSAFEWFSELIRFEQQRLELTLNQLLATEARRSDFFVRAVEDDVRLVAHDVELRARVDRIDELASGGFAIIDYKTGTTGTTPYWFDSEHADYQLPLYAVAAQQDVSALVLCSLNPERVGYRGFWLDSEAFPQPSVKRLTENEWRAQVTDWRQEIDALISGFIAGDNRIFAENPAPALGMYAPLTRLSEYRATETDELME